jgi:hypothetical protein
MATNMPPVHAVDGLYRPIYRRPGGPPADCPWGLIARATSRVMGRAVKVLVRIPRFIRTIIDPVTCQVETAGGGGRPGNPVGSDRCRWIESRVKRRRGGGRLLKNSVIGDHDEA